MAMKNFLKRFLIIVMTVMIAIPASLAAPQNAADAEAAYTKTITLEAAKQLGIAKSKKIKKLKTKYYKKQTALASALKNIALKRRKLATFSWSPLLSFKFPSNPGFTEEYEFEFKPLSIRVEMQQIVHEMEDEKYASDETVTNLYIDGYTLQTQIAFNEERLAQMQDTLKRNEIRLQEGTGTKADVDAMKKSISTIEKKISADKSKLDKNKTKLYNLITLDIRTGYKYREPYVTTRITRDKLESLTNSTLEHDHGYFVAKKNTYLAKVSLNLYYSLMSNQYGGKLDPLRKYVTTALSGNEVDEDALQREYDEFLKKIDKPWDGYIRIIFIKIQREWFKGSRQGTRYIDDDSYALMNGILEYTDTLAEEKTAREELVTKVSESFDSMVSLRVAYETLNEQMEEDKVSLEKAKIQNEMGELPYDELASMQEDYADLELQVTTALADYSKSLISLNRLTCGAVEPLLAGQGSDLGVFIGGNSWLMAEIAEGASYYIKSYVHDTVFEVGVYFPKDFEVEISDFKLFVNDLQIGPLTPLSGTIRHLALTFDSVESAYMEFYDAAGEFVDKCDIDVSITVGPLNITKGYRVIEQDSEAIANFVTTVNTKTGITQYKFTLTDNFKNAVKFYRIRLKDQPDLYLTGERKYYPIDEVFNYLSMLDSSTDNVEIVFYDSDTEEFACGEFNFTDMTITRKMPLVGLGEAAAVTQ